MVAGTVVVFAALATGCGGSGSDSGSADSPTTTLEAITTKNDYTVAPGTAIDGYVGARSDSTNPTCARSGDKWTATGTVKNSTTARADYRIYVSFVGEGNRAHAVVQTNVVGLPAGQSKEWTAAADIPRDGVSCVLRVERTTPKQ